MTLVPLASHPRNRWAVDDPLIARLIEPHPHKPGPENARLKTHGYSVWILIDALNAADGDKNVVAQEFEIPSEAVDAAIAFYSGHRANLDERIQDNASFFGASPRPET